MAKRQVEVFSAGCAACQETIDFISFGVPAPRPYVLVERVRLGAVGGFSF